VALSERLLDQVQAGGLDAALVHQVPGLASAANIDWEPLRRGRLAVIVSPTSKFARSEIVTLGDLRNETFLVNPRSLAPEAYEGFKLMCRQFGGFDAKVLESSALRMFVPATEGCAIAEGAALAIVPEETARMAPTGLAVVPLQAPPQYVIALAWRQGEPAPQVRQFIDYLRSYRDEHGW
jgi:DNA-binding transcriptional LysR family regulator